MHKVLDAVRKFAKKVWKECRGIVGLVVGAVIAAVSLYISSPDRTEARNEYKIAKVKAEDNKLEREHEERMAKIEVEALKYQNMDPDVKAELLRNEHALKLKKLECDRDVAIAEANAEAYTTVAQYEYEAKKKAVMAGAAAVAGVTSAIVGTKEETDETE